jgi:hypothetical protein
MHLRWSLLRWDHCERIESAMLPVSPSVREAFPNLADVDDKSFKLVAFHVFGET